MGGIIDNAQYYVQINRSKQEKTSPVTICSLCRVGQHTGRPPPTLIRRSRPTSVPSSTGGGSDATPPVLQCMPGTFPAPADINRGLTLYCFAASDGFSLGNLFSATHICEIPFEQRNSCSVEEHQSTL